MIKTQTKGSVRKDLAGSESVRHTGASGMQKKEGGMINQRCGRRSVASVERCARL